MKVSSCPCRSKLSYKDCCKRFHEGKALPPTALALMRSRFSAYALRLVDYIMDSTDPSNVSFRTNRNAWKKELLRFAGQTRFDDLTILDFQDGEDHATVTFRADLRQGARDASFTEKSSFLKRQGKWFYAAGEPSPSTG